MQTNEGHGGRDVHAGAEEGPILEPAWENSHWPNMGQRELKKKATVMSSCYSGRPSRVSRLTELTKTLLAADFHLG